MTAAISATTVHSGTNCQADIQIAPLVEYLAQLSCQQVPALIGSSSSTAGSPLAFLRRAAKQINPRRHRFHLQFLQVNELHRFTFISTPFGKVLSLMPALA